MQEIAVQKCNGKFEPASPEDKEKMDQYGEHQLLKVRVAGFKKPRSVKELNLFMACCQLLADNTDDPRWNTKEKVKFGVKVALHFVDARMVAVTPAGDVVFQYRSLSFAELPRMEATRFFPRAFDLLAQRMGISVEAMVAEAQERMRKRSVGAAVQIAHRSFGDIFSEEGV